MEHGERFEGAGEAHPITYGFGSESFARPFGHHDPTAVTALINTHFERSGMPRADWTLLAPLRQGESMRDRLFVTIDSALALELIGVLDARAEVAPTRSGKQIRARLKRHQD